MTTLEMYFIVFVLVGDEPPSRLSAATVPMRPLIFSFIVLYLCYIVIYMIYISSARMLPIATQARRLAVLCLCSSRPRVSAMLRSIDFARHVCLGASRVYASSSSSTHAV